MDNSACKKAVKSYKCKLQRVVTCMAGKLGNSKPLITNDEFIHLMKYNGCAERTSDFKTIEF